MSFSAIDEWLRLGAGAARDGDGEQARFYLERALLDDPTPDQYAAACYWLSVVADGPAARRDLLERALAAAPLHPEARRALAVLDGRLDPAALLAPDAALPPIVAGGVAEAGRRCPNCGGALRVDVRHAALACASCGDRTAPEAGGAVAERDWFAVAPTARGHRWVLAEAATAACAGCGATFALPPGEVSGACPYCAAPHLVAAAAPDLLAPDGVVPFTLARAEAARRLRGRRAGGAAPRPLYLPFWTFDVEGEVHWRAADDGERGTPPARGVEPVSFDDLLAAASPTLPEALVASLAFDTGAAVPYAPELLTGWPAELYRVPPTDASLRARAVAAARARERVGALAADGGGRVEVTAVRLAVASCKLLLLPVWLAGGGAGLAVVNGQTGAVHAEGQGGLLGRLRAWLAAAGA
jgi:hypothetical protein